MLPSFIGSAIDAANEGQKSVKCVHCGGWTWLTDAEVAKLPRVFCSSRKCEEKEGELRAAERAALGIKTTTIGQERDGRMVYHDGQCHNCGRQFMSDYERVHLAPMTKPGYAWVKFCGNSRCADAAADFARKHN